MGIFHNGTLAFLWETAVCQESTWNPQATQGAATNAAHPTEVSGVDFCTLITCTRKNCSIKEGKLPSPCLCFTV